MLSKVLPRRSLPTLRSFSSAPVYVEYPGNIFVPTWTHVPIWNIYGAEKTYSSALQAFKDSEQTFQDGTFTIADFCSVSCKNTMHVVTKLVKDLRTRSNREVLIHPTLLPNANWNEYFKLALSADYYGSLTYTFVSARPGGLWKQLFPSQHLNFIYANHSFMPISKMRVAADTIWPTMSEDPVIIRELRDTAAKDLDNILTFRGKEIKSGGRFCFDVLLDHHIPKLSCWRLLNDVVADFVANGRITQEERAKMALRNYQRNDDIINEALDKHKSNWRVVHKETVTSRFPAWGQYEIDKDAKKLARAYTEWLQEWTAGAILMNLAAARPQQEKQFIISDIYEELFNRVSANPMPLDVQLYDFVLQKL